ncbi:hypothetical protein GCM10020256_65170 [Streptomyces thermocoprophilus]
MPSGPEPHPDPDAGLGVGVQFGGDGVVEVPVEVEDALVDEDPGDGQVRRERGAPPGPRLGPWHLGPADALPDERELLRRRALAAVAAASVLAAHACILTKRH